MNVRDIILESLNERPIGLQTCLLEIVRDYLEEHGYDGLCCEECGCDIDGLAPCTTDDTGLECVPGYRGVGVDGPGIFSDKGHTPNEEDFE